MRESHDEEKLDTSDDLISQVLLIHGNPSNRHDRFKVLEEVKMESEKDICLFAGSLELLSNQLQDINQGDCSVCTRSFSRQENYDNAFKQLSQKIKETEASRESTNVVEIHSAVVRELNQSPTFEKLSTQVTHSRVTVNMRIGALQELRNQKMECLSEQRCFACCQIFESADIPEYLRKVDLQACLMQERLHYHS